MKSDVRGQKSKVKGIIASCLLPVFILIYSCSGSKTETDELKGIPIRELKERINNNSKFIETFEASGSISIETPEESNSGSIELRIKKPDSIYIKIEGPFGIDIATALITSKNFIYYNAQENKAILGPTNETNIGAILKVRMEFNELLSSLIGSFNFTENSGDSLDADSENNNYLITTNAAAGSSKYLIEPNLFFINEYAVFDITNKKVLDVSYLKYSNLNSVYLPDELVIRKPDKKQTIWINYGARDLNKREMNFKVRIPKSAKIIKWDK